jgi:hypothetical protein
MTRIAVGQEFRTLPPLTDQPLPLRVLVEQCVNVTVRRLLPDEALDFVLEARLLVGRQRLVSIAHGIDDELFANGQAH